MFVNRHPTVRFWPCRFCCSSRRSWATAWVISPRLHLLRDGFSVFVGDDQPAGARRDGTGQLHQRYVRTHPERRRPLASNRTKSRIGFSLVEAGADRKGRGYFGFARPERDPRPRLLNVERGDEPTEWDRSQGHQRDRVEERARRTRCGRPVGEEVLPGEGRIRGHVDFRGGEIWQPGLPGLEQRDLRQGIRADVRNNRGRVGTAAVQIDERSRRDKSVLRGADDEMVGADVDEHVTCSIDVVADDGVVAVEDEGRSGTRRGRTLRPLRSLCAFGPRGPFAPFDPCAPCGPCGPLGPCGPTGPGGPWVFHVTRRSLLRQADPGRTNRTCPAGFKQA